MLIDEFIKKMLNCLFKPKLIFCYCFFYSIHSEFIADLYGNNM